MFVHLQVIICVFIACPQGWYDSKYGTCYKFVSTPTSWNDAQLGCESVGANLAIVDTLAKAEDLAAIREVTGRYYYV